MHPIPNRILCIDDDEDTLEMMRVLLGLWNYDVTLANSAVDGLQRAGRERFDIYLLDSHLPDRSGFDVCEQLCEVRGHAPVVFISGAAYETDKRRGMRAGAAAYLTKPLDFDSLEETLAQLMPRRTLKDRLDRQLQRLRVPGTRIELVTQ